METPEEKTDNMYREQPDRGPSAVYKIYNSTYRYRPGVDKSIKNLVKGKVCVTGVVVNEDIPEEGSKFTMHYHKKNGRAYYGSFSIDVCVNVVEQDGCYYFESEPKLSGYLEEKSKAGKYILIPSEVN